ncbi:hypothetical protein [Streptomyces sp. NPDC051014]|uniref:hypothetical protein n=1 Tax=Streptomyces sp. NPDC051014 TaxID=3155751 RepID=UPI0033EB49DC
MAHTVGVAPERLEEADRPGAAEILREILRNSEEPQPSPSGPLSSRELETLAGMVASAAEGFSLSPAELEAAYQRAQELIEERRRSREGGEGEPPNSSRAS